MIKYIITFCLLFSCFVAISQKKIKVVGVVLNQDNQTISGVSVSVNDVTTETDFNGFYEIEIEPENEYNFSFSHDLYKNIRFSENLQTNSINEINIRMFSEIEVLKNIVIDLSGKNFEGISRIDPTVIRKIPGANPGIENILKTYPGVNSNTELSTQYSVRGGSYDENLIYVNEIEIFRPFLVRSGQQEGLSFINTAMIQKVDFSSGGFQAKYGDKMSSVLDISYRRPIGLGFDIDASLLGGGLTIGWGSVDSKWSVLNSFRYRNNRLLLDSNDQSSQYQPRFADIQSLISFQPNQKWDISFLGNYFSNQYDFLPQNRITKFGSFADSKAIIINYEGQEKDLYRSVLGAIKTSFKPNKNNHYRLILSVYHSTEQEYYDLLAKYNLGQVSTDLAGNAGTIEYTRGLGIQLNHGRNKYDALIKSAEIKATHELPSNNTDKKQTIEWGARYLSKSIRDRLVEWEVVDSAGFHIAPPTHSIGNTQPYIPYEGEIIPFQGVRATNFVSIIQKQAYTQYSYKNYINEHQIYGNIGFRAHLWQVAQKNEKKTQYVISPRIQIGWKPAWNPQMLFRLAGGAYHQPPDYRELRAFDGSIQLNLKAQKSFHTVLGYDYSFQWKEIPLKLTAEAYHKQMSHVNTYTLENVRIRYKADNLATAYAYGLDLRLNGEILPGTESWLSFGYMRTEENYKNQGYIARPTDQRLKFALLFQDYMPTIPNLKLYLNIVYNTGVPGGSPSYADVYKYQFRLPDYKRADAGFMYVLKDHSLGQNQKWLKNWQEMSVGFEIYNLFQNSNTITNTWVRDVMEKRMYAIPNYMTNRMFNLKLQAKW